MGHDRPRAKPAPLPGHGENGWLPYRTSPAVSIRRAVVDLPMGVKVYVVVRSIGVLFRFSTTDT